jgi:P-type Cu2+ transporter
LASAKEREKGVLFKNASALEATSAINTVIFNKTGTLTERKPALTDVITADGLTENELLRFAASADHPSQHPLAEAIVNVARTRKIELLSPETFNSIPGYGVEAIVGGSRVLIGNQKLMAREGVTLDGLAPGDKRVKSTAKDKHKKRHPDASMSEVQSPPGHSKGERTLATESLKRLAVLRFR